MVGYKSVTKFSYKVSKNSVTKCQNIQLEIVKKFSCTSVHLVQLYVQHVYVISAQKKIICVHHVYVPSAQKNMMMCNMCMWWQDVSSVYVPSAQNKMCMCQVHKRIVYVPMCIVGKCGFGVSWVHVVCRDVD